MTKTNVDALFVVGAADFQTPTPDGLIGDKFHGFYELCEELGWSAAVCSNLLLRNKLIGKTRVRVKNFMLLHLIILALAAPSYVIWSRSRGKKSLRLLDEFARFWTYRLILQILRPRVVMGICLQEPLILAARKLKVPTVELQHGAFPSSESLSGYWPNGHYPSYFLSWGNAYCPDLSNFGIEVLEVGYPVARINNPHLIDINAGRIKCCVSLSWGESSAIDPFGAIHPELVPAITTLESSGAKMVFRIHPYFESRYGRDSGLAEWLISHFGESVEVQLPSGVSLGSTLSAVNCHVTHSSSVVVDSFYLGIPSLVCSPSYYQDCDSALKAMSPKIKLLYSLNEEGSIDAFLKKAAQRNIFPKAADWRAAASTALVGIVGGAR